MNSKVLATFVVVRCSQSVYEAKATMDQSKITGKSDGWHFLMSQRLIEIVFNQRQCGLPCIHGPLRYIARGSGGPKCVFNYRRSLSVYRP